MATEKGGGNETKGIYGNPSGGIRSDGRSYAHGECLEQITILYNEEMAKKLEKLNAADVLGKPFRSTFLISRRRREYSLQGTSQE